jgi:hypothetical protein
MSIEPHRAQAITATAGRTGIDEAMIERLVRGIERAHRIAESLELGLAVHYGVMLSKGARFHRPGNDRMDDEAGTRR